jgi:hypothetical protein
MDYKNTVPWLLILLAGVANAECYIRSATVANANASIERTADYKRTVLPAADNKSLCRVTFSAYINGKWYLAQGEDIAHTWGSLDTACAKAKQSATTNILESVSGNKVTVRQDMMCTDEPMPKFKPNVAVGDLVRESEVQPHPIHFDNFRYRGALCRWFVESIPQAGRIDMSQGIMCRTSAQKVWKIVDKWQ